MMARSDRADLAFIGAGPKTLGILLAIAAGRGRRGGAADPSHRPLSGQGPGRIWRTEQSPHLWMNSRTEDITIFPDESCRLERPGIEGTDPVRMDPRARPGATRRVPGSGEEAAALDSQSFASRRIQGHYLSAAFETALDLLAPMCTSTGPRRGGAAW
jgi:uncharacterized NAD(P)/FAD-binding protein YdhS